ncbi:MAG: hypothetical protein IPH84_08995 [Bacteroidales bacterium]|nr:hypothetical protein [Bacteroidales bacterium]
MKTKISLAASALLFLALFWIGCAKEGPAGQDGRDGNANVIYSQWYTPNAWNGETGDWYFNVANNAISEGVVEAGVILAYTSLPGDLYPSAVRPLPAYAIGANWDFLIPDYGEIEFTSDALDRPGTTDYYFRFVIIPSNNSLKSTAAKEAFANELRQMSYLEVCKKYNIPE